MRNAIYDYFNITNPSDRSSLTTIILNNQNSASAMQVALDAKMLSISKLNPMVRSSFSFVDLNDMNGPLLNQPLYGLTGVIQHYDTLLDRIYGNEGVVVPEFSLERIALLSEYYVGLLPANGNPVRHAIAMGDRSEAWYLLRYEQNNNELTWIARHYMNSSLFGLYNGQDDFGFVSKDDAKSALQTYAYHRENILTYDAANEHRAFIDLGGNWQNYVNTYGATFLPPAQKTSTLMAVAVQTLLHDYADGVDASTKADITEVFVEFTPDSAPTNVLGQLETGTHGMDRSSVDGENALFLTGSGDDIVAAGPGNDIIVADGVAADKKQLDGGTGNDWIIGGPGTDNIHGGAGDDHLFGDAGNDTLAADTGTDELTGGAGTDSFKVSKGTTVNDLAADESVAWNGHVLLGAEKKDGVFQDKKGFVYEFTSDQKVVVRSPDGGTVTVLEAAGGPGPQGGDELFHVGSIIGRKEKDDDNGHELQDQEQPKYVASKLSQSSPLVMDLDGDGVELLQLGSANSYFDLDQDGLAERTGWVWSDDGLLARDKNGNGKIDDVGELFGTKTTGGFEVLATLDSNHDGFITSADSAWASLRVWRDLDHDGATDAGELQTLATVGVAKINLAYTGIKADNAGNTVTEDSTFTLTSGVTRSIQDVWFTYDNSDSTYRGSARLAA